MWEIILSDEIINWFKTLENHSQDAILVKINLLRNIGPALSRPHSDTLKQSRFKNLKELRVQNKKHIFRIFYAFDTKRQAIILLGGDKRGDKKFYERMIPQAEIILDRYLGEIKWKVLKRMVGMN